MRRYLIYFAVALLAFGIGSLIVINFHWNYSNVDELKVDEPKETTNENYNDNKPLKIPFTCEDEAIKIIWEKLDDDKNFIDDTHLFIEANQLKNCQELFERQAIDLNDDKSDEIILVGIPGLFCGTSRDCPTWIVSKISNEYQIMFEAPTGELPEGIKFLPTKPNKFKDLKVKLFNGWEEDNFGFFKFDGKKYQIIKCLKDVNSAYDYDEIREEKLISVNLSECL